MCSAFPALDAWGNWPNDVWEWGKDQSDVLDFLV